MQERNNHLSQRNNHLSQQSDAWAWQRTSTSKADVQLQSPNESIQEETPRCYMCGLKGQKPGKVEVEDQRQVRPRSRGCKSWCKFHMLKNPWSEHVTPSENYNPVWTGIPQSRPSSRPSPRTAFGDSKTLHEEASIRGGSPSPSTPEADKPKFYIYYDKALSHGKCEEKCKQDLERRIKMSYVPPSKSDPSLLKQTQDKKAPQKYCFACEKALVYKLFTQTLKIKREVEEAKYRSKDNWLKYNLKNRKGTTPVHAYWPTKTWDADHWPLLPTTKAQEKMKFTNQSEDFLEQAAKKKDARRDILMFSRC